MARRCGVCKAMVPGDDPCPECFPQITLLPEAPLTTPRRCDWCEVIMHEQQRYCSDKCRALARQYVAKQDSLPF